MLRKTVVVGATVFAAAFFVYAATTASASNRIVATQSPSSTDNSCLGGVAHCHKPYPPDPTSTTRKTTTTRAPRPPRTTTTQESFSDTTRPHPTTTRASRATATTASNDGAARVLGQAVDNTTTTDALNNPRNQPLDGRTGRDQTHSVEPTPTVGFIKGPPGTVDPNVTVFAPDDAPLPTAPASATDDKDTIGGGVAAAGIAAVSLVVIGLLLRLRRAL